MKHTTAIASVLLLTACSIPILTIPIDHTRRPVEDFPKLDVVIHRTSVDLLELAKKCPTETTSTLFAEQSCVVPDFNANLCHIYTWNGEPREEMIPNAQIDKRCLLGADRAVIRSQCWRCLGYERTGEMRMRNAWSWFKEGK